MKENQPDYASQFFAVMGASIVVVLAINLFEAMKS